MTLEYMANTDLKVNFVNTAPGTLVYIGDQSIDPIKVVPTLATKVMLVNKAACIDKITIKWTAAMPCPHTFTGHTFVAGAGIIMAMAVKTMIELLIPLRLNDSGTCVGSWTNNISGVTVLCACNCKIANAGQDKIQCQ